MNSVRFFVCDFPTDNGDMAERVRDAVLRGGWTEFDLFPLGGFRLVLDPISATLLRLFIPGVDVAGDQRPYLSPGDLFVPESLRPHCVAWLSQEGRGPGAWSELYRLDVWDEGARAAFARLYHLAFLAWRAGEGCASRGVG
jgi:hypothetical protein